MYYRSLILAFLLQLTGVFVIAQNERFTATGVIEYEKTINMFALIDKNEPGIGDIYAQQLFDQYKEERPQFRKLKSTLLFLKDKTIYTPSDDISPNPLSYRFPSSDQSNIIFTDHAAGSIVCQKKVFSETYLLKDSIRNIKWKLTGETREIAGYHCRRANAVIMDSVYVVAFYTDQIHISGGPESFAGLPGMILGVALPHENITWFATNVRDTDVPESAMAPPRKGKLVTRQELFIQLKPLFDQWPGNASIMAAFML